MTKLSQAVDTLLTRNADQAQPSPAHASLSAATVAPSSLHSSRKTSTSRFSSGSGISPSLDLGNLEGIPAIMRPSAYGQIQLPQIPPFTDQTVADMQLPMKREIGSASGNISPGYERKLQNRKREVPAEWEHDSNSYRSPASINSASTPSHLRSVSSATTYISPPAPQHALDQIMPSPVLSYVCSNQSTFYIQEYSTGIRWMMGNTTSYAKANLSIGRSDPRMNAISIGLVPMEKAKALFVFFAEKMQPHSFGFPTYPANEQMTPVIISSLLMVSTLFDPSSRQYHTALRQDCLASIKPEQEVTAVSPLDPELGIGVEEIVGACLASTWLGGDLAWRIARVVRWWAIGYLQHFEIPSRNVTLGECLTILPPFRHIDLIEKLRIWLAAYVAEAQQSFIFDRPSLVPSQNPTAYVEVRRPLDEIAPCSAHNYAFTSRHFEMHLPKLLLHQTVSSMTRKVV